MKKITYILCLLLVSFIHYSCTRGTQKGTFPKDPTFCNPMNLDYGFVGEYNTPRRTAADPVIVLFKDKYYLFTTHDRGGYRVSDDLINWENLTFDSLFIQTALNNGEPLAPAVATDGNYVYYINFGGPKDDKGNLVDIFRTNDPQTGKWEVCGTIRNTADPTLFIDNGRFFVYHGLGADSPTHCFEIDSVTMKEIPGSAKALREPIHDLSACNAGYYIGRREITSELDAAFLLDKMQMLPCPEGPWVVKNNNKYYLQIAAPGTASQWYSDIVMESDSPTGPFTESPYNPVSMKVGGFIGSAGHSCVFKDRYGNWWQVTTMWIGVHQGFERRIGLFPVKFDEQGRMKVYTIMGDYPMLLPQRKFDPDTEYLTDWHIQSYKKNMMASSVHENFTPEKASDEDVRTWWSAETGNPGEWIMMDLGKTTEINALQVNFAEQDVDLSSPDEADYHAYIVYYSNDKKNWKIIIDKSQNRKAAPHDYVVLEKPLTAKYLRVENTHTAKRGKFAISDLRVFGKGDGNMPAQVVEPTVERNQQDERFAKITWQPSENADGYLIRFGYQPDFLNLCIQVKGNDTHSLTTHILTKEIPYFYRIDSYNGSGITQGEIATEK